LFPEIWREAVAAGEGGRDGWMAVAVWRLRSGARPPQLKLIHVADDDGDGVGVGGVTQRVLASSSPERRASSLPADLVVRDGAPVAVDCVAVGGCPSASPRGRRLSPTSPRGGGCPPASVFLRLGRRDVDELFSTGVERSLTGERRGMRAVNYRVVRRHRHLTATAQSVCFRAGFSWREAWAQLNINWA